MASTSPDNGKWPIVRRLAGFGLTALFFALAGYLALVSAFPYFSRAYSGEVDWSLLEGYASLISLALITGSITFAIAEYSDKESAKRREKLNEERERAKLSYDIYQAIFHQLTDPEQEAARRWILTNVTIKREDEDIETWYQQTQARIMWRPEGTANGLPEGQKAVKMTLNCLDYIGFIANHYWEIDDDSLDWISPPIAKIWKRVGPYVLHIRTLRKAKDYYLSAEQIGKRCTEWRQRRGFGEEEYARDTL